MNSSTIKTTSTNNTDNTIFNNHEEYEIELIELFRTLLSHKILILTVSTLISFGAYIYALSLPDMYTAEITLSPSGSSNNIPSTLKALGGLASLAGITPSGGSKTETSIAILKSRSFIMEFIKKNNLMPILFDYNQGDKELNAMPPPTLQKGYAKFNKDILSISQDKKTGLIIIKITWSDPTLAADWANMLINQVNSFIKKNTIDEANLSIAYLKAQIKDTSEVNIQELLYRLIEKELQTAKLASVKKDYAFKILDPALIPEAKSAPNRVRYLIYGVILGFFVSMVFIFCKALFIKQRPVN